MKGGQYAQCALDNWYYPPGFVGTGFFNRLFSRPAPLDFTRYWNHLPDYLAGAASKK